MTLHRFIEDHTQQIQNIEIASNLAWWNLATTGEDKYAKELEKEKIALRKIYSSSEDFQILKSHRVEADPQLSRQRTLLLYQYRENQIPKEMIEEISKLETDIEATYTNFRPIIKGHAISNNDLKKILIENNDSKERKEAWEASKLIGEQVEDQVLKLISLRNFSAQQAGFSDFYSMRLELQELDQNRLFSLLARLEDLTNEPWKIYKAQLDKGLSKRFGIEKAGLMPWHYQDPFFQEAPRQSLDLDVFYKNKDVASISKEFYLASGMPVDDIINRSDLYEREKKNQHAFCTCIDRKQDVRVLCNLRDNEYWMGTMLHELGHAVYDKYIDQSLPYILRSPAHTSSTEAIAMLFGRLSKDGDFLHRYAGLEKNEADAIDKLARQQNVANLLVFARWTLVMIHFERAMYQQPGVDLNNFWWECVKRFQDVKSVPGRKKPDWASKLHLACAPVYYQNYILGEMTASQLRSSLLALMETKKENFCSSTTVGNFLTDKLFKLGSLLPWEEALSHATGENLEPQHFVNDIKIH